MPRSRSSLVPAILASSLAAAALAACQGQLGEPPPAPVDPPPYTAAQCKEGIQSGPAPVRRMTRFEYDATVRDLLGDDTHPAAGFGAEEEALGFANNATALTTSTFLAEKYLVAAEEISDRATTPLSKNVGCDPTAIGDDACAAEFVADFLPRAFRRAVTADELDTYFALYQAGRANPEDDFRSGIRLVIEGALNSPDFLYRVELGGEPAGDGEHVRVTSYEMASRLSYFLWGSMPDAELFDAAEAGELDTNEGVLAQAQRMLNDPKARDAVREFHRQWLDFDRVRNVGKSAGVFPEWSPELAERMVTEAELFVENTVFDGPGTLAALYTSNSTWLDADLAAFYGASGPEGAEFEPVSLPAAQRSGLLTLGAMLSFHAHSNASSPVHRGKFVREQLFCEILEPPPPNLAVEPVEPDPNATIREKLIQHQTDPSCSGCHKLMDSIGFGFEAYDGIGRFRTTEAGKPVDDSGYLTATDVGGAFDGIAGLASKLTESEQAERCYVRQYFRYAYGRGEVAEDYCSFGELEDAFASTDGSVTSLLAALTQTDAFLYRRVEVSP